MSNESETVSWFGHLSEKVKCLNCKHWDGPDNFEKKMGLTEGMCSSIPAYGGAHHMAGTEPDMFCSEFEIKPNV
jgi:hypothetical protein